MRRMMNTAQSSRDDSGAATIFVVMAMLSILIGAGFAIDVGQYVVSARSAQNTADATALAVATDCVNNGSPIADYSPYRKPGQTTNAPVCGANETTITTTKTVGGLFLKQTAGDVNRSATAKWGSLSAAATLPIVISDCEFDEARLNGDIDIIIYLDDTKPQSGCSSLPGGFSGLDGDGCSVPISADGTAPGQPGVGVLGKVISDGCITPLPREVLFPMYDSVACEASGCKGNGQYPIVGFATFRITGYSFNGVNYDGTLDKKCPDGQDRGRYCIQGDFIRFTTSNGTSGSSTDFGTSQIYLSD
jgi:Flp pilus assembly protein TadG